MKMVIENYNDALALRSKLSRWQINGFHLLYRGHASNSFELLSTIGRKMPVNGNLLDSERKCFLDYKHLIADKNWAQYKKPSYNDDLFYMSIGRHLGLDCRLLDWTASLETALFFASANDRFLNENGHLWIMVYEGAINDSHANENPFNTKEVTLIKESYYSPKSQSINEFPLGEQRRFAQNGFFTIVPSNLIKTPLNRMLFTNIMLKKVNITVEAKQSILEELSICYSDYLYKKKSKIEIEIDRINANYFK